MVALVIGVIALMVAVPSAIQMMWGKPKIMFRFREADFKESRILTCEIWNEPIQDSILKLLGVYRRSVVIMASFQLFEAGTNRVLFSRVIPDITTYGGIKGQRVTLDSSIIPVSISIIQILKDGKVLQYESGQEDTPHSIPIGEYYVELLLTMDGDSLSSFNRFYVSDRYPYAGWI